MMQEVGIYRGSFDPPHNGHLEAVTSALGNGLSSVFIIYKDPNISKPFRTSDEVRNELLITLFEGVAGVVISQHSFKPLLQELNTNPTIIKIYEIVGSDILNAYNDSTKPSKSEKMAYFIQPRIEFPISNPVTVWNHTPVTIGPISQTSISSSAIRELLFERDYEKVAAFFNLNTFHLIEKYKYYVPTDNEYVCREMLREVKKGVEKEIVQKKIVSQDQYPLSFHLGSDIGVSGLSGDLICFVKDRKQNTCLVVKIFKTEQFKANFESEIIGYNIVKELNLKLVKVPQVYFSNLTDKYAFIGMSFANGETLANVMGDSPEAIDLCARANLELHLAVRTQAVEIKPEQIAFYENYIKKVIDKLSSLDNSILLTEFKIPLEARWNEIHNDFIQNPGLQSFTHGDPNHRNCIVDLKNNCVTYIDLSLFQRSLSPENTPWGFAINELEESLFFFEIAAKYKGGFNSQKVEEMRSHYKQAYLKEAPADITTKEAARYFAALQSLRTINYYLNKFIESTLEEDKNKFEKLLRAALQAFI